MGGGPDAPPQPQPVQFSGGSPNYIPSNSKGADLGLQSIQNLQFGTATTLPNYLLPQYQSISNDIVNNPYAAGAQQAGVRAGEQAGQNAQQASQASNTLQGMGMAAAPYGQQILQTGFDPQQALYNRTQQQLQDQLRAQNAASGLSSSPYGAGVVGQGLSNFNIDWQNQQLQRQGTALQGYGALNSAVGQDFSGANALGQAATGAYGQQGAIPYQTAQGISQNQLGGLGALSAGVQSAYAPSQTLANNYQSYLGLGQSASGGLNAAQNANYQNQLNAFNAQQAQQNASLAGLGSLGSGLFQGANTLFGGGSGNSLLSDIGSFF